jgi:trk system potassium uptake protein TrkA
MDVFVAMTGDDEDNLVACQIAHAMGVKRTVAIINKASYAPVYDLMGVDTAISPRLLCAKLILRFVRSSSPQAVSILAEGKAEVLELRVERDAPARIQDLGLHPEAKVGARLRGDAVIVPSGSDELASGDRVIVLATSEALPSVEEALGGRRR